MKATATGRFYATKYEADRMETMLRKSGWYYTDGSSDYFVMESSDGGKIKFSKIFRDAYDGYNVEIISAKSSEELAATLNDAGNILIDDLVKLSGLKSRPKFSSYFGMSKRSTENWALGISKTPEHMLHLLEYIIMEKIEKGEL